MNRRWIIYVSVLIAANRINCAQAACYLYNLDGADVLTGTIIRTTFPGAPHFESIADGDEVETGLYFRPTKPICVHPKIPNQDNFEQNEDNIRLVQVIAKDDKDFKHLRTFTGRKIRISGTFDHAFNGHHHTPVLLDNPKVLSYLR